MQSIYRYIDPAVLMNAAGNDADSFRELSKTFLRIAPQMVNRLQAAVETGDCTAAMYESHSLKGTAALVGAAELARTAARIESASTSGDAQALLALMPSLVELFSKVMLDVQNSIDRLGDTPNTSTFSPFG